MAKPVLLFDLGGVIIQLGEHILPPSWWQGQQRFQLHDWLHSATSKGFETGQINALEFANSLKAELSLSQSIEEILYEFAAWPEAIFDGALELLAELRDDYILAALSNINELHAPRMLDEFHLDQHFDHLFFSHEMGLSKPDPLIFEAALAQLKAKASDIVFFDDVLANVEVARQLGIKAHRVDGPGQIRALIANGVNSTQQAQSS